MDAHMENMELGVCPANCVCQQTNLSNDICIPIRMMRSRITEAISATTTCDTTTGACPQCEITEPCATCAAYATLLRDIDTFQSNYTRSLLGEVEQRLEALYNKYKGVKSCQSWLSNKNQNKFRIAVHSLCTYIKNQDEMQNHHDMKDTACGYICRRLCGLQIHYTVAFSFWMTILRQLLKLHHTHVLDMFINFLDREWKKPTRHIQAIRKCVNTLIAEFPEEFQRFAGVNIYDSTVSSILHLSS